VSISNSEKRSLVFYQEMKQKWGKEEYIKLCSRHERNGLVWMKAGVWKLRGIRRGWGKRTCPLCGGNEDVKHVLLSCSETKKGRMQSMNKKWLCINEEVAYKKIVHCTTKNHIIHFGEYLDKVKHKWESRVRRE
jgi:hypothetical protein